MRLPVVAGNEADDCGDASDGEDSDISGGDDEYIDKTDVWLGELPPVVYNEVKKHLGGLHRWRYQYFARQLKKPGRRVQQRAPLHHTHPGKTHQRRCTGTQCDISWVFSWY